MTTNNHTAISTGAAANASTINTPLGALDAAIGNRATLGIAGTPSVVSAIGTAAMTTTAQTLIGAINELDGDIAALGDVPGGTNLLWDPIFQHTDEIANWNGISWWQGGTSSLAIVRDSGNPWGSDKLLRVTTNQKGKGTYLDAVGLAPGDVISAAINCTVSTGTYYARLYFRESGPGSSTVGSMKQGASYAFSADTYTLTVENITIPDGANWVEIVPYSASFGSVDVYAMWLNRGSVALDAPDPSPFTATYLRYKEWEGDRQRLMVRNIDASNFAVYQPLPDGQTWIAWLFTHLATGNWTYYGANMASDNAGTGAYGAIVFDVGYSINYTPSGQSAETCGNHHEYEVFTTVNFYNQAGTVVDPTASGAAFNVLKMRIEQKGTLRHPDTGSTDHANISRFIEVTMDGVYEHQRLTWLTDGNLISYWNTGQLLASSATRAWVHNDGDAAFTTSDSTKTVVGATTAYSWYHSRAFTFKVYCPTCENIQLRQTTLKVYPRTIDVDVTRDIDDVDHAEWYWSVIYDKQFEKRI